MEELTAGPPPRHRERRHRRKASATAAYGDVFGGPPRFAAAPFAGVPGDYAEVFGGVAASCSIPYLDLPPADADRGRDCAGGYGEIFARFDFGEFAAPYEDMFAEGDEMAEEIASWSGSSRSSVRKESGELDSDPSLLYQHSSNLGYDQHYDEERFSPISFSPDGEQQFIMSYNKATRGRLDDVVEMTTCMVEPSISYVVDSCNLSNDSAPNQVPVMDKGTLANGENREMAPPPFPADSDHVTDEKQCILPCVPISENLYEDENDHKRCSTHSASSEETTFPDYPFLRVSNVSIETPPIKVQPPSMLPSKPLNKKESKENGNSEVNPNSAAAAAIKEAMDFAGARLKAAKELTEGKGGSFKLRKRQGHHRATKSTEIKENKIPEEVHVFEEQLSLRRLAKEEKNYEDLTLPDKKRDSSVVKLNHCYDDEIQVLPPGKPQQMMQNGSKLDQLGKWTSGTEFYELISHDLKCKSSTAAYEGDNAQITNPFTKPSQFEKDKGGVTAGDSERYVKILDGNDIAEERMEHLNLRKDDTASIEVEHKAPTALDVTLREESVVYQETTDPNIEEYVVKNSPESHNDDEIFEISCINDISPETHDVPETSSLSSEGCISGGHANDNKNSSGASTKTTSQVGMSDTKNSYKEGHEIPCTDETLCTSIRNQISLQHFEGPNIDETEASQVKLGKVEESAKSCEAQYLQMGSRTLHREDEPYEKDTLLSFVDETCLQNEKETITGLFSEALIHKGMKKFGTGKAGPHEDFQQGDVDSDAGSPEKEVTVSYNANEKEEAEMLNVENIRLTESNVTSCGTFDEGSDQFQESQDQFQESQDQFQESQGSLGSQDLANKMDGVEDLVSHGDKKEAKEPLLQNSEKTPVEDTEGQTSTVTGTNKGLNDVYAEIIASNGRHSNVHHSENEVITDDCSDCTMIAVTGTNKGLNDVYAEIIARNGRHSNVHHSENEVITDDCSDCTMKTSTCSKDLQPSFSEACISMQHLSQNAEPVSTQMFVESTHVLQNLEEDCIKVENSTKKYTTLQKQKTGTKTEEQDGKEKTLSVNLKDRQCFVEDNGSKFVQKSREENHVVQRFEGRDNARKAERETVKEKVSQRLDEEKARECMMEKEKVQTKERLRRDLEEVKERERERAKDRLAVQRATREAHERAFAEARATGERIALERITSARQRASAEVREKEEKGSAETATEKSSREARIKAERAAVERATAEARERAIEKAKAAAEAKERMEKFRSASMDSCKATNQGTQFQRTASNNYGRSTDSCNQVSEVESALRHKARSERHQRTAERAEKALAEKNMRDMLAQREQAEKHRLAEFLDPEVKRWSNGKEGNLRALLSTLQYILGSDSGWQSVPLTDLITAAAVKKAYRRATLCVHPDKLQQRRATIRQKYICEKVFDLLKEGWNKFNSEER